MAEDSNICFPSHIVTRASLADDLRDAGLLEGDCVCVHVALSQLGLVIGGARTLVEGMLGVLGADGTLMMPGFSGDLSDPKEWQRPPVPPAMMGLIRDQTAGYDKRRTPTRGIGLVAEYFRTYPGTQRSSHPQSSFVAYGAGATALIQDHRLDDRFGPKSPLGKLLELNGKVLLLGAPYRTVSLFHMTQHLVGKCRRVEKSTAIMTKNGDRRWVSYGDIEYPTYWFEDGVAHLINEGIARTGVVGGARTIVFSAAVAIDEIVKWRRAKGFLI